MAEPPETHENSPDLGRRLDAARVAVLGLNAWAVLVFVPLLAAGARSGWSYGLTALGLVLLAAGAALLARAPRIATWLLLALFPVGLAALVATLPSLALQKTHSLFALLLGAVSLVAYGAFTAAVCARPSALRATTSKPLEPGQGGGSLRHRRVRRRVLVVAGALGAFAVAVMAPLWHGDEAAERAWGDSADEGRMLTAVAAAALGAAIMALFIGPGTRRSRSRPPTARQAYVRAAMLVMVALAGVLTWWIVTQGGKPSEAF